MSPTPLPDTLKVLQPYLQRATETKSQDPVISYWCTYYAAQMGLSLKPNDKTPERTRFMTELLDELEKSREILISEYGADLIKNTDASCAYIENFAMKVFLSADNEDRAGAATRNTARKFLGAAYFFELLNIFDRLTSDNAEKVKYAKWRTSEITKAIRLGVQPQPPKEVSPNPAVVSTNDGYEASSAAPFDTQHEFGNSPASAVSLNLTPDAVDKIQPPRIVTPEEGKPEAGRIDTQEETGKRPFTQPEGNELKGKEMDDDLWSNAANLGSRQNSFVVERDDLTERDELAGDTPVLPSSSLFPTLDEQGHPSSVSDTSNDTVKEKKVHWTPSVTGGSSVTADSLRGSPEAHVPALPSILEIPQSQNFASGRTAEGDGKASRDAAELSHKAISQVQKHCRFAISALEYEDIEHARKELLTALHLLGG